MLTPTVAEAVLLALPNWNAVLVASAVDVKNVLNGTVELADAGTNTLVLVLL